MNAVRRVGVCALLAALSCLAIGCGVDQADTLVVRNDTEASLDPGIFFSDSPDAFPAELLNTGLIAPGDSQQFNFACAQLGAVMSDSAQLVLGGIVVAEANDSAILTLGSDFGCGETIEFRYITVEGDLLIEVRVNGLLVD